MRQPPITITCDCGASAEVPFDERWRCEACGRTWDTGQIPTADYDALLRGLRRYRLLVLGPPIVLAAILLPLAVLAGIQFGFLLFVFVMAHGLLVVPQLRRRATDRMRTRIRSWKLHPE